MLSTLCIAAIAVSPLEQEILSHTHQLISLLNKERGTTSSCVFPESIKPELIDGEAKQFFAAEQFYRSVLHTQRKYFTQSQYEEFKSLFGEVLRSGGDRSRRDPSDYRCTTKVVSARGNKARVNFDVTLLEEDIDLVISLQWERLGENWKVTDLDFDGASLARDYRNQFARIIEKKGPEALLAKLRAAPTSRSKRKKPVAAAK